MKSLLAINGNDPNALMNSTLYDADAAMYDLAEAVDESNKDAARILLQEALKFFDFGSTKTIVRVNRLCCCGLEDIQTVGAAKPYAFIIQRGSVENVAKADAAISAVEAKNGIENGSIALIPTIETIASLEKVADIIAASPRIKAVMLNASGLLSDMGVADTGDSDQLVYARTKIAMACRAAGIDAIDTPFRDVKDTEGLKNDAAKARSLGFTAKLALNGNQVPVINGIA